MPTTLRMRARLARCAAVPALLLAAAPARAAALPIPDSGDSGWLLAALLVGLATALPGLLLLAVAVHGRAHGPRIVAAALASMAALVLAATAIGYSLMFDTGAGGAVSAWLGGGQNLMLRLMGTLRDGTSVPETAFVALHIGFALVAVTLLVTALAPRARPGWLLGFSALWFLIVLVPVTRWLWGGGWLETMGALDGAGGLVVFAAAALSALTAMLLIGAPAATDAPVADPLAGGGAALLLAGMLALTGAATLGAGDNAAVALLVMLIAAAAGSLALALLRRSLDLAALAAGLVAGTVAAAGAGDALSPGAAMVTGALAALAAALAGRLLPASLGRHAMAAPLAGIAAAALTGVLLTAPFLSFELFGGSGYADGMGMADQLLAQLAAVAAVTLWSVVGTAIAALMMGVVVPMRAAVPPC